jgi:hypothetical protein
MDLHPCLGEHTREEMLPVPFAARVVVLVPSDWVQENVTGDVHLRRGHRVATAVGVQLADERPMGLLISSWLAIEPTPSAT